MPPSLIPVNSSFVGSTFQLLRTYSSMRIRFGVSVSSPISAHVLPVAVELENAHWETAQELAQTANELQMISDSRVGLTNLGTRTGIDGYKRLGTTLIQTMQYGTPLTDALKTLSAEMRQDALVKFEARAARLPVMLTMPTILFILPCVFLIAGGPAIIQIMRAFN